MPRSHGLPAAIAPCVQVGVSEAATIGPVVRRSAPRSCASERTRYACHRCCTTVNGRTSWLEFAIVGARTRCRAGTSIVDDRPPSAVISWQSGLHAAAVQCTWRVSSRWAGSRPATGARRDTSTRTRSSGIACTRVAVARRPRFGPTARRRPSRGAGRGLLAAQGGDPGDAAPASAPTTSPPRNRFERLLSPPSRSASSARRAGAVSRTGVGRRVSSGIVRPSPAAGRASRGSRRCRSPPRP